MRFTIAIAFSKNQKTQPPVDNPPSEYYTTVMHLFHKREFNE